MAKMCNFAGFGAKIQIPKITFLTPRALRGRQLGYHKEMSVKNSSEGALIRRGALNKICGISKLAVNILAYKFK